MFAKYETKPLKDDHRLYDDWITISPEYTKAIYKQAALKDRQEIKEGVRYLIDELIELYFYLDSDRFS